MTRDDVIKEVANNPKYIDYCKRVTNRDPIYQDLFQYIIEVLIKLEEKKLIEIFKRNELGYYFATIAYRSYHSYHSGFAIEYKHFNKNESIEDVYPEFIEAVIYEHFITEYDPYVDQAFYQIKGELDKTNQNNESEVYDLTIFKLHLEGYSSREIGKMTGIPFQSIAYTLKEFKNKIKNKVEKKDSTNCTPSTYWVSIPSDSDSTYSFE